MSGFRKLFDDFYKKISEMFEKFGRNNNKYLFIKVK